MMRSLWISFVFLGVACGQPPAASVRPVLVDTDMARDDWEAVSLLLHAQLDVVGISISCTGIGDCDYAEDTAARLVALSGLAVDSIPIARGDRSPIDGYRRFPESWRADTRNHFGVDLAPTERSLSSEHAVTMMRRVLMGEPAAIDLLILGPMTNVAQLLERHPEVRSKIARLIIMGGAVHVRGNIMVPGFTSEMDDPADDLANPSAEWNIYADGLAAHKVLHSGIPMVWVPLDGTNTVPLTYEYQQVVTETAQTASAEFYAELMSTDTMNYLIGTGELYFWDSLAALMLIDPWVCRIEELPLAVDVQRSPQVGGQPGDFPERAYNGALRKAFNESTVGTTALSTQSVMVDVCTQANKERFYQAYQLILNDQWTGPSR